MQFRGTVITLALLLIGEAPLLAQDGLPPPSLQEKMQRFHPHAKQWHRVSLVMKDFQPLMEQGKFEQAEATLDRALKILEAGPGGQSNTENLDRFRRNTAETQYLILPIKDAGHLYGGAGGTKRLGGAVERMKQRLGPASDLTKHNWDSI